MEFMIFNELYAKSKFAGTCGMKNLDKCGRRARIKHKIMVNFK